MNIKTCIRNAKYYYGILINKLIIVCYNVDWLKYLKFYLINAKTDRPVIWVRTELVRFFVPNKHLEEIFSPHKVTKSKLPSFIFNGNWDKKKLSIDEYYHIYNRGYRTIYQMFVDKIDFYKTDEYKYHLSKINDGEKSPRGKTIDDLNAYFESLIRLENLLKNNGYKSQKVLKGKKKDEIGVFIGRNGEIIKAEDNFSGTHRFALAKLHNIPMIPVHVLAIHKRWAINNIHLFGKNSVTNLEKYFQ